MTEQELADIEARLQAATPGPWVDHTDTLGYVVSVEPPYHIACTPEWDDRPNDMALIAAAPTDIAALVAEVRRLRAMLANRSMPKGSR